MLTHKFVQLLKPNKIIMISFYTYLHLKPNGDPFYVGKGCSKRRSNNFSMRNQYHKRVVAKCGGKQNIEILVFPRDTEQQAFDDEIKWIRVLRENGYELTNLTDGGEGLSGLVFSPEHCAKIAAANKGDNSARGFMNKKHSPESCAKISASKQGKPMPCMIGNKNWMKSKGTLGYKFSAESIAKIVATKARNAQARKMQISVEVNH